MLILPVLINNPQARVPRTFIHRLFIDASGQILQPTRISFVKLVILKT
jgi:hypothetical protein